MRPKESHEGGFTFKVSGMLAGIPSDLSLEDLKNQETMSLSLRQAFMPPAT